MVIKTSSLKFLGRKRETVRSKKKDEKNPVQTRTRTLV